MSEKKRTLVTCITALVTVLLFYAVHLLMLSMDHSRDHVKFGFIMEGDESTPYSANYIRSVEEMQQQFGDRVEVVIRNNVPDASVETAIRKLAEEGCDMIMTNSYGFGEAAKKVAGEYPDIQFCEATCDNANTEPFYDNYHTFMGEIYEGRYIAGKVAGLKLQEMIDQNIITEDEAWIGYVGAFPYAEVISGYTSFFLGVRSECPSARMRVRYTDTWSGYSIEKVVAEKLIAEGCVIISQHSDTIGPAVVCEKANVGHPVYHVGYNQDMIDVAPTTSLIGTRINWTPYMCSVAEAMLADEDIESRVDGNVHGNDAGAGFSKDWVKMLELNTIIAADGSQEMIDQTIQAFEKGTVHVFQGDYTGTDPFDPQDTIDLRKGYTENAEASAPGFHYVLDDVIVVEEDDD